ncbi:Fpg/Nei family DNA glycosylase [Actinomyces slackii]|uniref:DNA-(apurinic or apyrimidinic site) lyase n=1 Tax=Actinomyces slackii TaxID=52774 RepID=A0A448KD18_9ACTO|nr:DNA-formamidopyrimidine glycosylase family protein [Actinomyces slackii]VEG74792.1 DNA glycosylase/AP lyase Nei [Actinomyces slackii]
MPEGHTIHRLAAALGELYGGQRLRASSPQGRFSAGAQRVDGQVLLGAQAHGKHLFLPFGPEAGMPLEEEAVTWLRIHLGLYGSWTFDGDREFTAPHAIGAPRRRVGERGEHALSGGGGSALAGLSGGQDHDGRPTAPAPDDWQPPDPRGAVRLRLQGEHGVADLTGPAACEVLDGRGVAAVRRRLGPDPLRADGDPQVFVEAARSRRRAIAELLMDQAVIAGAGNIFRAEVLFRVGVAPLRPGNRISQARLRAIWEDLVPLMDYGVATGFITTVDPRDVPDQPVPGDQEARRWYVYHRTGRPCLRCGTAVREQDLAGRRLFWCPACQAH